MDAETKARVSADFARAREALDALDHEQLDCGSRASFNASLKKFERAAWDRGFQMAAKLEQGHMRQVLASHVLNVLGKDAGDGAVDLGTLGTWHATDMGAVEAR